VAEATAVRDAILKRFPFPDTARFVVLGDFNDTKASKPLARFARRGDTTITALLPATDTRGETWTYAYARDDSYARIDHILVSPVLIGCVQDRAAHIFDGDGAGAASDHRAVFARFNFADR
jgi:endonuclease/exonuclease/phosphatase family metal-dependent hydrolase